MRQIFFNFQKFGYIFSIKLPPLKHMLALANMESIYSFSANATSIWRIKF